MAMASASSMLSESRIFLFCSSAAPVFVVWKTTLTSASSPSAFSQPLRAMVQKLDVVLVMKATVFTGFGALVVFESPQLTDIAKQNASTQISLYRVSLF